MLSQELIKKIRHIQIKAGRLVTDALAGEYSSAFRGQGMEFDKVREYVPGDDVRHIDWNVTARTLQPHIKVYKEERELTMMLLVDVSASLRFSTSNKFKNELAAELAAILAFMADKNQDKVGLLLFSDHVEKYIPAKKGRSHIWHIIREVLSYKGQSKATNLNVALEYLANICKRHVMSFVVSDFYSSSYEKTLKQVAKRHEVICIAMDDESETKLPKCGFVNFIDPESGRFLNVNTSDTKVQKSFIDIQKKRKSLQEKLFRRCGVDFFRCLSSDSVVNPLIKYMHQREHKSR